MLSSRINFIIVIQFIHVFEFLIRNHHFPNYSSLFLYYCDNSSICAFPLASSKIMFQKLIMIMRMQLEFFSSLTKIIHTILDYCKREIYDILCQKNIPTFARNNSINNFISCPNIVITMNFD